jgi:hypothetical protein
MSTAPRCQHSRSLINNTLQLVNHHDLNVGEVGLVRLRERVRLKHSISEVVAFPARGHVRVEEPRKQRIHAFHRSALPRRVRAADGVTVEIHHRRLVEEVRCPEVSAARKYALSTVLEEHGDAADYTREAIRRGLHLHDSWMSAMKEHADRPEDEGKREETGAGGDTENMKETRSRWGRAEGIDGDEGRARRRRMAKNV